MAVSSREVRIQFVEWARKNVDIAPQTLAVYSSAIAKSWDYFGEAVGTGTLEPEIVVAWHDQLKSAMQKHFSAAWPIFVQFVGEFFKIRRDGQLLPVVIPNPPLSTRARKSKVIPLATSRDTMPREAIAMVATRLGVKRLPSLTWDSLLEVDGKIHLVTGKKAIRWTPLDDETLDLLEQIKPWSVGNNETLHGRPIVPTRSGGIEPLSTYHLRKCIDEAADSSPRVQALVNAIENLIETERRDFFSQVVKRFENDLISAVETVEQPSLEIEEDED